MATCGSLKGQGFWSSPPHESSKVEEKSEDLLFYFPCDLGFRSHYGKGQKSPLYWYILASPSGSQLYYLFGHVSWYKEPFIFGLLMGQFPGGKTNRVDEFPLSLLLHPILGSNHKEDLCFYSLIKPAWLCPHLCLFCFFLTLPRPSSIAISSGRTLCSRLRLEFVSTHSSSTHPLLPPRPNTLGTFWLQSFS